ncbi:hypothetical protein ACFL0D_05975 [Thermoproteota archaeon]
MGKLIGAGGGGALYFGRGGGGTLEKFKKAESKMLEALKAQLS